MKKQISLLLLICSFFPALSQQSKWFTVKAFLPFWNGAEISLYSNNFLLHKGTVVKDMFVFTGNIDVAAQGALRVKMGKQIFYIPVFLEPGTIKVRDAGTKTLISYGTSSNDIYFQLNESFDSLVSKEKNLSFSEAIDFKRKLATVFIRDNSSSIVSAQLLKDYYYLSAEANDTIYHQLVHGLDPSLHRSFYVQEMLKEADARFITAIGKRAPLLEVSDSCGRPAALYSTGKYTLVDFWASWCVPCRKENPALLKLFKRHHEAGFTITGISLDENKWLWLKAIKQDKLLWQQLTDLKGWESPIAKTYGIKAIPMNYLINREGVIIAKNINAEQLDKMLTALLKTNN